MKLIIAMVVGAIVGSGLSLQINRSNVVDQDAIANMAFTITGAVFGAACVLVARWDRNRTK